MANTLTPGDRLVPGAQLTSDDVFDYPGDTGHFFKLILQRDGNLVLYRHDNGENTDAALWASGTNGRAVSECPMQDDGNLVIYGFPAGESSTAVWASNTQGHPGAYALMQDDGNFVIYPPGSNSAPGTALWATRTVSG